MEFVKNVFRKSLAVGGGLLLSLVIVRAQTPAQSTGANEKARAAVNLSVIVTDETGRFVGDLTREDVRVTEDGVAQTVTFFAQEVRPVSYGLVVDTTGSLRSLLDQVIETGRTIVEENRAGDETFVMHYTDSDTIEVDQGWTSNRAALGEALDSLFIQGGATATLDALHSALTYAARPRGTDNDGPRRRALVIITDGEDRGSRQSNPETLLSRLRQSDVQVFAVGLTRLVREVRNRDKAVSLLTRIAEVSGGRAFFPKSVSEVPDVLKELAHDLRTQYTIGYTPTNAARDGSFRKVQITLAPGKSKRTVIARTGYTAPQ